MPLRRPQCHPPVAGAPGRRRLHRRGRLREVLVRIARVRGLRHVPPPAGRRLHAPLCFIHGRWLQGGRVPDRVRRARQVGEVRIWLQRAGVPSVPLLAHPRPVHATVPSVRWVWYSVPEEDDDYRVYRDVLCHCCGVDVDAGELFYHRLVLWCVRQVLPRFVRHLHLDHRRLHGAR